MNTPTPPRLTPAQRRALDWLPADGGWRSGPSEKDAAVLRRLWDREDGIVDWATHRRHYRLTPAGIALKARLAGETGEKE